MKRIILFTIMMLIMASGVMGIEINLTSLEDTYVDSGSPNTNYGTANTMNIRNFTSGITRFAYIKFNVSELDASHIITSSVLRLKLAGGSSPYTGNIYIYGNASLQAWNEDNVTWNTRLGMNVSLISENAVTYSGFPGFIYAYWNVSNIVNASKTNENITMFVSVDNSGGWEWSTKEGADTPLLTINYNILVDCLSDTVCCNSSGQYIPINTDPNNDCTDSGYDGCVGSGTPYSCVRNYSNIGLCNGAGSCASNQTNVTSGSVCNAGAEVIGSGVFYSSTGNASCSSNSTADGFGNAAIKGLACDGNGNGNGPEVGTASTTDCGTGCCYSVNSSLAYCNATAGSWYDYYTFPGDNTNDWCYNSEVYACKTNGDCQAGFECDDYWKCVTAGPDDVDGWSELMDGNVLGSVYAMFVAATNGWIIIILFFVFQYMLFMKTDNVTACWVTGIFFASMYATGIFIKPIAVPIMFTLLAFELGGVIYMWIFK